VERGGGEDWSLADSWIWARLQALVREVERLFQAYQYARPEQSTNSSGMISRTVCGSGEIADAGNRDERANNQDLDPSIGCLPALTPSFHAFRYRGIMGVPAADCSPLSFLCSRLRLPEALMIASCWSRAPKKAGRMRRWRLCAAPGDHPLHPQPAAERRSARQKRLPATLAGGAKSVLLKEQAALIAALAGLDPSQLTILETLAAKPENNLALVAARWKSISRCPACWTWKKSVPAFRRN